MEEFSSCYVAGGLRSCASATLHVDGQEIILVVWPPADGVRITAVGLYLPGSTGTITTTRTEDLWQMTGPAEWSDPGFLFKSSTTTWNEAVGGRDYGAEGFWAIIDGLDPSQLRFAWRGETEDRSLTFDCLQDAARETVCTTIANPEVPTLLMVLTGIVLLAAFRYWRTR